MKRYFALLLALAMCLSLVGCKDKAEGNNNGNDEPVGPSPSGPSVPDTEDDGPDTKPDDGPDTTPDDGPVEAPRIKLGVLMDSAALGAAGLADSGRYDVRVGDEQLLADLAGGALDGAIVPVSSAVKAYNETDGKIQIAAITASGGWVLVERGDSVKDIFGLVNRTVYLPTGYDAAARIFEHVTGEYGYIVGDTLDVRYVDADTLAEADLALMPSMLAGRTIVRDAGARIALDLQEQWTYLTDESFLPAACLAVSFGTDDETLSALLADLKRSQEEVSDHLEAAVALGLASNQEEAWAALEGCKLIWAEGADVLREELAQYLSALYDLDPALIGGFIPDDGFYR